MKYIFGGGIILQLWIPGIILQLLMNVIVLEADLHPIKTGSKQWTPSIFFANPYVVRYPLVNQNASILANLLKTKSAQGRAFGDSYINDGSFDYTNYADIRQDKAVPVNPNGLSSSIPAGSSRPGSATSIVAASYPLVSQQYPSSYPYPSGGGYYYPAPSYLPPTQYWPPSQNFNTFDYGSLYPPGNSTGGLVTNTKNQFIVQPNMCSNSIQVVRSSDVEILTSYNNSNQTYVCIIMLYGVNEYNRLAVSVEPKQIQQQAINGTSTDSWLQTNVKMYSVQGENITLIDTK